MKTAMAIGLTMIVLSGSLRAQVTAPQPEASSQPASAPADPSTPRGALKRLSIAMESGDEPAMRSLMYAANEQERKIVDAQIAQSCAFAGFRRAAVKAFGESAANDITGDVGRISAEQLAKVDAADVKVEGNQATVTIGTDVYALNQSGNGWQVAIGALLRDTKPQIVEQIIRDMNDKTGVVRETTDEIAAGKYGSTDDVLQAFRAKAMQLHMQRATEESAANPPAAATQPGDR